MSNLSIYEAARKVPQEACKSFNNGRFSGTDINPMWRIKKLTELFGACGIGWYYEVLSERSERLTDDTVIAVVDLNLYIKQDGEWSKPIYGTGGNQLVSKTKSGVSVSDEGYKMALTDALSVACKALGIGADIYFDKDKTKYTQHVVENPSHASEPLMASPIQIEYIAQHASPEELEKVVNAYGLNCERMSAAVADKLIAKLKGRN